MGAANGHLFRARTATTRADPNPLRGRYGVMDARQLIAYLLLALMAAALLLVLRHATRGWRAHNRAHRAAVRRARERIGDTADRS